MPTLAGSFLGFEVEEREAGVHLVTLNRPRTLNALSLSVKRELAEWLVHAQVDERVRAVVFTGAGTSFCSGDDISGRADPDDNVPAFIQPLGLGQRVPIRAHGALRMGSQPLARTLREFDKPTVAAINGHAVQSGLTLALACDFRIASTAARLTSGTLRFAFMPDDGGHHLLVLHLGLARALDFVMLNEVLDAPSALALGLVREITEPDRLLERALGLATQLADGPSVAMRLLKRAMYAAAELTFDQALEDIATKTAISDYHEDTAEGMAAFRERRKPVFNRWLERGEG